MALLLSYLQQVSLYEKRCAGYAYDMFPSKLIQKKYTIIKRSFVLSCFCLLFVTFCFFLLLTNLSLRDLLIVNQSVLLQQESHALKINEFIILNKEIASTFITYYYS